jgi:hypothetical protein
MVAESMKKEKIAASVVVSLLYLPARYRRRYHSPTKKTIAGMRWEYMLTVSLCA